ncbi:hypothetical protein CV133_gene17 [Chlorobiaceae phage CV-1-33]|nr:hypothetical protein [Chlorobiaceae bacterium]QOE32024.1 hypothetical protein CV133_gene17 [Chlorobiaceae phage CV-1-33]
MTEQQEQEYLRLYAKLPERDQVKFSLMLNRDEIVSSETQTDKMLDHMQEAVNKHESRTLNIFENE